MIDILLVEPDKVLAKTYKAALQGEGYTVAHQTGAQTAIHSVDKQKPSLVILELQLAAHNGVEFLYELRSYADWQNIPIIVLSNIPPNETGMDDALQQKLGIVSYCYKPHTSLEQLISTVKRALT